MPAVPSRRRLEKVFRHLGGGVLGRELALFALPAAAALVVLLAFGSLAVLPLVVAVLVALLVAGGLARLRISELGRVQAWLDSLTAEPRAGQPVDVQDPAAERLMRPVLGLARRLDREQRDSAARQRLIEQLVEALPDPILLVDGRFSVVQANTAAQRSFGIDSLPVQIGRVLRDPGVMAAVGAALEGQSVSELTFRPIVDQRKQFAARIESVELPEGGRGALLALREETEQVMIERMRSDFVANASHEIRNPLASLVGFIETLRGPARDDPAARESFLEIMAEETARMTRLVDDLLSLSRIELAADQPPDERCTLAEILARVIDTAQPSAARHRVRLVGEIEPDLPPIQGTPDQLHQLVSNLVDNAIKYGGDGKTVTIGARLLSPAPTTAGALAGRQAVAVSVADEGPGIAAEHIPRLTERFYRVDRARSRHAGGTGLGLAIVKHIVRRHRGELVIESELGRGSRFTVLFPVR